MDFCLAFSRKVDFSKFAQLISDKIQLRAHLLVLGAVVFAPHTQP